MNYKYKDLEHKNTLDKNFYLEKTGAVAGTFYDVVEMKIDNSQTFELYLITIDSVTTAKESIIIKIITGNTNQELHRIFLNTYSGVLVLPNPIPLNGHIKIQAASSATNTFRVSLEGNYIS